MSIKQRTLHIDGTKIVIRSRPKTHLGNLIGYGVNINGQQFNIFNEIYRDKAEDKAYAKWVSTQEPIDCDASTPDDAGVEDLAFLDAEQYS